jgi:hypothetical protein
MLRDHFRLFPCTDGNIIARLFILNITEVWKQRQKLDQLLCQSRNRDCVAVFVGLSFLFFNDMEV